MAQHDYVIANGSGSAVRSDLNNALAAIVSHNSGTSEPTTTYAYMPWADTSAGVMKLRNGANNAWITLYQLDGEYTTIPLENGTAAAPSLYFKTSGTDTGLYSPGTDQVAISTGGTGRLFINSSGAVGIGTSTPGSPLEVQASGNGGNIANDGIRVYAANRSQYANFGYNGLNATSTLEFGIADSVKMKLDSSGRLGIGTNTLDTTLTVGGTNAAIRVQPSNAANAQIFLRHGSLANNSGLEADNTGALAFYANGSERSRIDSSGRLLAGTSTAQTGNNTTYARVQVVGNSGGAAAGGLVSIGRSEAATSITTGETLGTLVFGDSGPGEYAWISCEADATAGTNDYPGRLVFSTTADGAASPTERLRIANNGQLYAVIPGNSTLYPGFMARAWVNFDGTGTVAIRASGNVSSITDNGAGDYTVNFTTAMVDTNYAVCTDCQLQLSVANFSDTSQSFSYATGSVRVACGYYLEAGSNNYRDQAYVHVSIFR